MKKLLSFLVFAGVLLVLIGMARPVFADPIAEKSPQYADIIQALDTLQQAQADPAAAGYTAAELSQKISDLRFQKYIQESTEDWGVCTNATTATIGVYGYDPDLKTPTPQVAYLGAGQTTDDDWACTGVYLPSDATVTGIDLAGTDAIAQIVDGTHLTISQDLETGSLVFDAPVYKVLRTDDVAQPLPQLAQADVAAQVNTVPVD